jgi:lipopolysaccharide heptosyltransferase I
MLAAMTAAALRNRNFERILLIKPSAVGDVIHTLPVLVKLRQRYPQAQIDWLLIPPIAELIRHHPAISNTLLFPRNDIARFWRNWSIAARLGKLLAGIRRTQYDLVLDLHGQFRSALFTLLTAAPVRIGFDRPRKAVRQGPRNLPRLAYVHGWTGAREGSWLAYTHRIPVPTLDVHAADRYLSVGPMLNLDEAPPDFRVPLPGCARDRIDKLLELRGPGGMPYAVLVPGTQWQTKHWTIEGFAAVGRHLIRIGRRVVLAGSTRERSRCQEVAGLCPGALNFAGQTTLSELAALIERADLCLANDSGSMHLAVALGRPVVSIFGPTDEVWIGPYARPHAVIRSPLPCAPCYLRQLRACPHDHACMKSVTTAQVIERVNWVLAHPEADRGAEVGVRRCG